MRPPFTATPLTPSQGHTPYFPSTLFPLLWIHPQVLSTPVGPTNGSYQRNLCIRTPLSQSPAQLTTQKTISPLHRYPATTGLNPDPEPNPRAQVTNHKTKKKRPSFTLHHESQRICHMSHSSCWDSTPFWWTNLSFTRPHFGGAQINRLGVSEPPFFRRMNWWNNPGLSY